MKKYCSRKLRVLLAMLLLPLMAYTASAYILTVQVVGSGTTYPGNGYNATGNIAVWGINNPGWKFDHWENAATGSLNYSPNINMNQNRTLKCVFTQLPAFTPSTALKHFVAGFDANYSWSNYKNINKWGYSVYFISYNSQAWLTTAEVDRPVWQHYMQIYDGWFSGNKGVFLIDGGDNGGAPPGTIDTQLGMMSLIAGCTITKAKQIPNEPLTFTDETFWRGEDDILAYGLNKFLLTGDYKWICHQAMVKAAVRGMDTVTRKKSSQTQFMVVGASKRGWATWLTAAYDDPRIICFNPIVIGIPNISAQMEHHWDSYGFYAPAVTPYVNYNLFCRMISDPNGPAALEVVDPYKYLGESTDYTKPKLITGASGDQFFMPDSLRYYYASLTGDKRARFVPNNDHGMSQVNATWPSGAFDTVLKNSAAWALNVKNGAANPTFNWTVVGNTITVTTGTSNPTAVKLWQATNPTARDFRYELIGPAWSSTTVGNSGNNTYIATVATPPTGYRAFFIEATFANDHCYTSEIVVRPDTEPFDGTSCQ